MVDINEKLADFRRLRPSIENPAVLRSMLESLASRHYSDDRNYPLLAKLLDFVFDDRGAALDRGVLSHEDAAYVSNIMAMSAHVKGRRFVADGCKGISVAPQETDFVVRNIDQWPLLKFINFALLSSIRPSKRAAVMTSIRNEGASILEWVAHYQSLGFDRIFVYTNNNTDGSTPLLEKLAKNDVIRLVNNIVDAGVAPQTKSYEHSLHFLPELRQYRWVLFVDADEFFIPRCGPNLDLDGLFDGVTSHFGSRFPDAISFNWKWFGSHNAFEKTDGLLMRRFEHSIHNEHVKTLAQLDCVLTMKPVHCPVMFRDCTAVDSQFRPLAACTMKTPPVYGVGQINHYWNKSFQEFVIKKYRGRGAVGTGGAQREFTMFFDWGANDRLGNYDPPPSIVADRTQTAYDRLLELPGISDDLATINEWMTSSIAAIDKELDLRAIYDKRGRIDAA